MGKKIVFRLLMITCLITGEHNRDVYAQKVSVIGELRSRTEMRDGFKKPLLKKEDPAFISLLRSRINATYADEATEVFFSLQDSRTLGETGTNTTGNSLGLFEAWGAYQLSHDFKVKVGRQTLEYDDKRILSASNWSNTGNAHDLGLLQYKRKKFQAHLGIAWNNAGADLLKESDYTVSKSYKFMSFLWLKTQINRFSISAITLNDAFQNGTPDRDSMIFRNTMGVNVLFQDKDIPWNIYGTSYYQFGHDKNNKKLSAYLFALKISYAFTPAWHTTLGADWYSGSKADLPTSKNHTFNKLYGVSHSFNGAMEYWTTIPTQGLQDFYASIKYVSNKKLDINLACHFFSLVHKHVNTDKKGLGSEIDLVANYKCSPQFSIQGGYSMYFTSNTTDILKDQIQSKTRFPHWGYLMLIFKPSFF